MSARIETRTRHKTLDGMWHDDLAHAEAWAGWLDDVEAIEAKLRAGAPLGELADEYPMGYRVPPYGVRCGLDVPDELRAATKDSLFTISHWQCCDEPTYSVYRVLKNGNVILGGKPYHDREWPGWYSSEISMRNLMRHPYTTDTPRAERPTKEKR